MDLRLLSELCKTARKEIDNGNTMEAGETVEMIRVIVDGDLPTGKPGTNVIAIGRLENAEDGRWKAFMQLKHKGPPTRIEWFFVNNPKAIPDHLLDDGEYHLFKYNPDDQFCTYIDLPNLQRQAAKAAFSLNPAGGGDLSPALDVLEEIGDINAQGGV